ncbi:TPA: hypothetical protein N0F65_011243 [Lagenidium giganteum]|uniref:Integrase catalytic domain-containing protein n=1 Tax=Lagenidium giganteum TaxID=4803 RepID=A0AAV2YYX8_9STRA|nr:TPA: hypothetical protein N0F65_011243 [Lagenidium giganteum]
MFTDQGGEFLNAEAQTFYEDDGLQLLIPNGYAPQENGMVERGNGLLMEKVRTLLAMTHLPMACGVMHCSMLWGQRTSQPLVC